MAFERNDIVFDSRLMAALGDSEMGFDHNDIVTVDKMNAAIAAGGGGGGGDYTIVNATLISDHNSIFDLYAKADENYNYTAIFDLGGGSFSHTLETMADETTTAKLIFVGDSVALEPYNHVTNVTGNAVYDSDTNTLTVTGDFTISGYIED